MFRFFTLHLPQQITFNAVWLIASRVSTALLNLLLMALIARYLGEVGFGRYAFITSILFIGNTATTFGMDTLIIRAVARTPDKATSEATAGLLLQLFLSAVFILAIFIWSLWLDKSPETILAMRIHLLSLIPLAFGTIYSAILRGTERMDLYFVYIIVTLVIQTLGAWWLLQEGAGLVALMSFFVLAYTIATGVAFFSLRQINLPAFVHWQRIPTTKYKAVFKTGWILALIMVATAFSSQLAIFSLSLLADDASVGWYSAASKIADGGKIIPAAIFGALFPMMTRGEHRSDSYQKLFIYLLLGCITGVGLGWLLAKPIITFVYGSYAPSVPTLQVLLLGLIPFLWRLRLSFELITQDREGDALYATLGTVCVSIPMFYLLVTRYQLPGAAWATNISLMIEVVLLLVIKRQA